MFRFFLIDENEEPLDAAVFVSIVPNWEVEEVLTLGSGEQFRILEIRSDLAAELLDAGFNGVFVVEPA